jgi:hypothetical protein
MPIGALVFLTPSAALVGLAFLVPLAALVRRERVAARVRGHLGLRRPNTLRLLARPLALIAVGALVAAAAAQPAIRKSASVPMRADAEIYLTFDVTRSMLARQALDQPVRLERARVLSQEIHAGLLDVPTGVATLTNRMMPLLFPTSDERGVSAVLGSSVRIMQPQPARLTAPRATQLGVLTLAADRSYYNPEAKRRALVVFSDLDTDYFSLEATLRLLRAHDIEPFVVRVAQPGEQIFDVKGNPLAYRPSSTVSVGQLRRAGWHAFEESEANRVVSEVETYLGTGTMRGNGLLQSQRNIATYVALLALLFVACLTLPGVRLLVSSERRRGVPARARAPRPT